MPDPSYTEQAAANEREAAHRAEQARLTRRVPDLADDVVATFRADAAQVAAALKAYGPAIRRLAAGAGVRTAARAGDDDDVAPTLEAGRLELERELAELLGPMGPMLDDPDVAATARDLAGTLEILDRRTGERDAIIAAHRAELDDRDAAYSELDRAFTDLAVVADRVVNAASAVNSAYLEPAPMTHLRDALEALGTAREATR